MSVWLILAMGMVLASWIALLAILVGIGLGLQSLVGVRTINTSSLMLSPWNGFAILILFLQAWHFVFPVRWPALLIAAIGAAIGLWSARRELQQWFRSVRMGWKLLLVLVVVSIWIANRAVGPGDAFDSGFYHYSVVRWNHEHPIVPGLANLFLNFGFNNSCHLFDALLQVAWWDGRANHLANGLLVWIWLATVVVSASRLLRGDDNRAQHCFNLVLAIPLVMYGVSKESASPTSDLPQALVAFAAASGFVRLLAARGNEDPGEISFLAISVVMLCAAAVCIKLSSGPLVVSMTVLALGVYLMKGHAPQWRRRTVIWACGLSLALSSTWVARNLLLSGCPFFPGKLLAIPVEWRIPTDKPIWLDTDVGQMGRVRIAMLQRATSSDAFSRLPGWLTRPIVAATRDDSTAAAWVIGVVIASTIEVALPSLIAIAALILILGRRAFASSSGSVGAIEWLACVPPLISLACWAAIAPEPRFGAASFWILAATLGSMVTRSTRHPARLITAIVALSIVPIAYRALVLKFNPASGSVIHALFIPAGPDHGFHPTPVTPLKRLRTKWGLTVFMPVDSPLCWDAPLPATPLLNARLRLRAVGDLESGFVLD